MEREFKTVDLNDAFDGKEPEFMDGLFPGVNWRAEIESAKRHDQDWSWFWDAFAPHGMLMDVKPVCENGKLTRRDRGGMSFAVLKSVAMGLVRSSEPDAVMESNGEVIHYWPFKTGRIPDDLIEYSNMGSAGEAKEESCEWTAAE